MLNYASVQPLLVATAFCSSVNFAKLVLSSVIVFPVTVAAGVSTFIMDSTVNLVQVDKLKLAEIGPKPPSLTRFLQ